MNRLIVCAAALALAACQAREQSAQAKPAAPAAGGPTAAPAQIAAAGAGTACSEFYRFDSGAEIPVADLMRLAKAETSPISADDPRGGVVVWRAYDAEEGLPENGEWQALGLLFVVRHGAASGGMVWADKALEMSADSTGALRRAGTGVVEFTSRPAAEDAHCRGEFMVRFDSKGALWDQGGKVRTLAYASK